MASGLPELSRVAEAAMPGVVGIVTSQTDREAPPRGDPMRDLFEHYGADQPRRGLASGFVIAPDGLILTNAHVIDGVARIEVDLGEEEERLPARVVGKDDASDVALLRVDAGRPLPTLPLGDSDAIHIADWLLVIGNPFGLSHSVTVGVVSHLGRGDVAPAGREGFYDFIQTDASINPGNSGGPVLNVRGEVIGIATAVNATGQGIGFAVPINMAKEILAQLRDRGRVVRSWMGVSVRELREGGHGPRQVVVTDIVHGGPAATGGLAVGDVITAFDGRRVGNAARLRWYVATAGVGRNVALTVRRGEGERAVRVELATSPDRDPAARRAPALASDGRGGAGD
ncbi:MAG TPA: trypsin-like peptidase domain-containing protein [Anaeromyxobacteraceae bacterium]|nr:trypsin-like peptidase domain-containing protein [Anaeromyxobacteraceae bacterium]